MRGTDSTHTDGRTRRQLLAAGGLAAAGLAGCVGLPGGDGDTTTTTGGNGGGGTTTGTGTGTGATTAGTTELADQFTFLHFETQDDRKQALQELASAWAQQSGSSVNPTSVSEADLPTQLQSRIASNTLPGLAELSKRALYSVRDAIDPGAAASVVEQVGGQDAFYEAALELTATGDGGHYGVPLYTWPQLTLYRSTVQQERGLPEPTTWENIRTFAEATHQPDQNQFGILLGSDRSQYTLQCFEPFALSNDAHVFDTEGNVVFDSPEMVEALEFYTDLLEYTPPGDIGPADVGPVWNNGQVHLYSSNSVSFYYESLAIAESDADVVDYMGAVPYVENTTRATFGEVVSTATFQGVGGPTVNAANSFAGYLRGSPQDRSTYIDWCHLQPGLFQPVFPDVRNDQTYLNNENIQRWPETWIQDVLPTAIQNMGRFGHRDGNVFPEIGQITGNYLVTDAIREIASGGDAQAVASATAEEMRTQIS